MSNNKNENKAGEERKAPGKVKISQAVIKLLRERAFHEITWGEIARTAEVSEALISLHYKDRPGLLCGVLEELLAAYVLEQQRSLRGTYGALNKLRHLIWNHIEIFNRDRVYAKLLLLEIRSFPLFFESGAYRIIQEYGKTILDIIKEGIYNGEIRKDIDPEQVRQVILGAIEHLCLPLVIFGREFSSDHISDEACNIIFHGIGTNPLPSP